jgi:hypothetical protein
MKGEPVQRIDVVKKEDCWVGQVKGGDAVVTALTKAEAVKRTADYAKASGQGMSVRIHKADGKIDEERTYPRASDPRRSKG